MRGPTSVGYAHVERAAEACRLHRANMDTVACSNMHHWRVVCAVLLTRTGLTLGAQAYALTNAVLHRKRKRPGSRVRLPGPLVELSQRCEVNAPAETTMAKLARPKATIEKKIRLPVFFMWIPSSRWTSSALAPNITGSPLIGEPGVPKASQPWRWLGLLEPDFSEVESHAITRSVSQVLPPCSSAIQSSQRVSQHVWLLERRLSSQYRQYTYTQHW